jgi:hypothetical protein
MFGKNKKKNFNGPWSVKANRNLQLMYENALLKITALANEDKEIDMEKFLHDLLNEVADEMWNDGYNMSGLETYNKFLDQTKDNPFGYSKFTTTIKNLTPEQAAEYVKQGYEITPIPGTEKKGKKK